MPTDTGGRRPTAQPAADYDVMVDWAKRVAREAPLFHRVFDEADVASVIDVGCGTGMLTIEFARWGLTATGVDPSEDMLGQARENVRRAGLDVPFVEGSFGELSGLGLGPVDAVTCTGNAATSRNHQPCE